MTNYGSRCISSDQRKYLCVSRYSTPGYVLNRAPIIKLHFWNKPNKEISLKFADLENITRATPKKQCSKGLKLWYTTKSYNRTLDLGGHFNPVQWDLYGCNLIKSECSNGFQKGTIWHQIRISRSGDRQKICRIVEMKIRGNILKKNLAVCIVDGMYTIKT